MNLMRTALLSLAAVAVISGCASSSSGSSYSRSQTRGEMLVRQGVVESVRQVSIESATDGTVGTVAGAIIGGIAGSKLGRGNGSTIGSVLGAVAGGAAGNAIEGKVAEKAGLEITIKLDSGQLIAVTQDADEHFAPGERVRVLSGQGATRVSH